MNIVDYLNYEQIRATLGLDDSDLPDDILKGQGLEDDLVVATLWLPDDAAIDPGSKAHALMKVFVKNWAAAQLLLVAPHYAIKQLTDGEDGLTRQTVSSGDYLALSDKFAERATQALQALLPELGVVVAQPVNQPLFGVSPPSRDPVTEGRGGQVLAPLSLYAELWPIRRIYGDH